VSLGSKKDSNLKARDRLWLLLISFVELTMLFSIFYIYVGSNIGNYQFVPFDAKPLTPFQGIIESVGVALLMNFDSDHLVPFVSKIASLFQTGMSVALIWVVFSAYIGKMQDESE
jgi:hypothetical protein